jgi:hypothetical protein
MSGDVKTYVKERVRSLYELTTDLVEDIDLDKQGESLWRVTAREREDLKRLIKSVHTGNPGWEMKDVLDSDGRIWMQKIDHHVRILGSLYGPREG